MVVVVRIGLSAVGIQCWDMFCLCRCIDAVAAMVVNNGSSGMTSRWAGLLGCRCADV